MINTLRLTHLILYYVVLGYMFRSSLTIIRPVCESCFTNAGYIIGIPLCLQLCQCVYLLYKYIKVGGRNRNKLQVNKNTRRDAVRCPQEHTQHPHIILVSFTIPPRTLMYLYNRYTHWHSCKHNGIPICSQHL